MPFNTTNETLNHVEDYEGKELIGTVVVNTDPENIGRIQVSIPDLYNPQAGEVPYVGRMHESPFGYGTSAKGPYGVYGYPQVGTKVRVVLQHGDEHYPMYEPMQTQPDANPTFASPNVWGFTDPDGNTVIYDMAAHTYKFITAGGAVINIDANGKRITQVNGDETDSNGNWTVNVTGAAAINSTGNTTVNAQGSATVQAASNVTLQAGGTATYIAAVHQFQGPVVTSSTLAAAGDITDLTASGNSQTMANMREKYDIHTHPYDDDGTENHTGVPDQQI